MLSTDRRVEILDVDEGFLFVVEGAETGDHLGRAIAEDLRHSFDQTHENILAGNRWSLMPEIYCYLCAGDDIASSSRAGCEIAVSFYWLKKETWVVAHPLRDAAGNSGSVKLGDKPMSRLSEDCNVAVQHTASS